MKVIDNTRLGNTGKIYGRLYLNQNGFEWICPGEEIKIQFNDIESIILDQSSSTVLLNNRNTGVKMIHFQEIEGLIEFEEFLNEKSHHFIKEECGIYVRNQQRSIQPEIDDSTLNLLDAFAKIPMLTRQILGKIRNEPDYLHRPRGIKKSLTIPLNPWIFDRELKLSQTRISSDSSLKVDLTKFPLEIQATMIYNSGGTVLTDRREFWKSVLYSTNANNSIQRDNSDHYSRIEKDLRRSGEDNEDVLSRLELILRGYCCIDPEIGYVQGMADLALPFAKIFDDQEIGLNCFTTLMKKFRGNFLNDGIADQLKKLRDLINEASPLLSDYLKFNRDSDNLFFAYRWLLLVFRREFEENDRFWDVMLAADASKICKMEDYPVFVALAMILSQKKFFMSTCTRFEDLLLYFHGMSGKWNLDEIIKLTDQLIIYFKK